ncbi:MAG: asparagine synthase (glutamine-hydrolyzing) [Rhodomicrobium sp.]
MCGLAGIFGGSFSPDGFENALRQMGGVISHRGPDDSGTWFDCDAGVGLVHRRLSILDLSPAGHQPMASASGRFVIAFNGEIYNHPEIRSRVQASIVNIAWRGHSDTETLLAGFDAWGIEETLRQSVGMFAFAVWDRERRTLILARDRMGEKPLYYGYTGSVLAFGSELKALLQVPGFSPAIDRGALALLLRHACVPAPHSIYEGLAKLPPATWLEFSLDAVQRRSWPKPMAYWSAERAAAAGVASPLEFASSEEAADALESMLRQAIAGQMVADVPVGAFLSGGVDSSVTVALMQALSSRPVKSFTIGFNEAGYDEAIFAKEVARHLGTEHIELYVSPQEALDAIPELPEIYSEPFADPSQIPTFLVAKLARQHVTVSLSGDGGDELFGGYNRYLLAARLWDKIERIPVGLRRAAASGILAIPPSVWDKLYAPVASVIPKKHRLPAPGDKLHKGAPLLYCESGWSLYQQLVKHWPAADVVLGADEPDSEFIRSAPGLPSLTEQMMLLDTVSYLPDDILAKVDRAAMAVSLESRAPLIDHRLYEFAWRLPLQYKIRGGTGKWLLRQVLYKHVPRKLIERPKMGFAMPIDSWLRGPLRGWAEELLDERRIRNEGYLNPAPIRQKWREHLSGTRNWQYQLWAVLMFQAWHEANKLPGQVMKNGAGQPARGCLDTAQARH